MEIPKYDYREDVPDDFTGACQNYWGDLRWFLNGQLHKEDGPAMEDTDDSMCSWYLNDIQYSEEGHRKEMAIRNSTLGKLILSQPHFGLDSEDEGVAK